MRVRGDKEGLWMRRDGLGDKEYFGWKSIGGEWLVQLFVLWDSWEEEQQFWVYIVDDAWGYGGLLEQWR